MIGHVLDNRYRVIKPLGEGGASQVYLVEHIHLGRQEAMKILQMDCLEDADSVSRFRREARLINRLHHPNIIGVHDFGQTETGHLYLTTEFMDGYSLASLRRRAMPVLRVIQLTRQLCSALVHAHGCGIVHRDIKPENLLLVKDAAGQEVLKVFDFGIAKILEGADMTASRDTSPGHVFGTPEYMAPEQVRCTEIDARTDLYAVGVLMYELLTGTPLFDAPNMAALLKFHLHEEPTPPSVRRPGLQMPPELELLIMKCLAKEPEDRVQSAEELLAWLDRIESSAAQSVMAVEPVHSAEPPVAPRSEARTTDFGSDETHQTVRTDFAMEGAAEPAPHLHLGELNQARYDGAMELAEALLDQGGRGAGLPRCVARIRAATYDLHQFESQREEIRQQRARIESNWRQREAFLRLSISELKFDDKASGNYSVDTPRFETLLASLEGKLVKLVEESQQSLDRLLEKDVEIAAANSHLDDELDEAYASLADVLAEIIPFIEDDLLLLPLIESYRSLSQATPDLREAAPLGDKRTP